MLEQTGWTPSNVSQAIAKWWWVVLLLTLVGGMLGYQFGGDSPRRVKALLRVNSSATEGQTLTRLTQTAVLEASTPAVYARAAASIKADAAALFIRTQVSAVPDSLVVSVEGTARRAVDAVAYANAVAEAAVVVSNSRREADVKGLAKRVESVAVQGRVGAKTVEAARQARLGEGLGDAQIDATVQNGQLTLLQRAGVERAAMVSSRPLTSLFGAVGGLLCGVALALLGGVRRGRIRSLRRAKALYRDLDVVTPAELPTLVEAVPATLRPLVVAASTEGLAHRVAALVEHAGDLRADQKAPAPTGRVAVLPASRFVLGQTLVDDDAVVFIAIDPRRTAVATVDRFVEVTGRRTVLVVGS